MGYHVIFQYICACKCALYKPGSACQPPQITFSLLNEILLNVLGHCNHPPPYWSGGSA